MPLTPALCPLSAARSLLHYLPGQGVVQQASVTRFAHFMFANLCDTAAAGDTGQSNAKVRQTDMAKEMEPVVGVL